MYTISAEELLKAYNGKYKYVTESENGCVRLHITKPRQESVSGVWLSANCLFLNRIAIIEFQGKDWTECIYKAKPSEEDWVGYVGWFWDGGHESISSNKCLGILELIDSKNAEPYKKQNGWYFQHFRPATRDEIKFFNDDTSEE